MIAAKVLISIFIPLSFLAGTVAERAVRPLPIGEQTPAATTELGSPRSDIRVVYPAYGMNQPVTARPPVILAEPVRAAALDREQTLFVDDERLDINTASIQQLDRAGAGRVGKAIARRRPYNDIEDLVRRRVLTRADFKQIRDRLVVR
jgi:hypothetical protein